MPLWLGKKDHKRTELQHAGGLTGVHVTQSYRRSVFLPGIASISIANIDSLRASILRWAKRASNTERNVTSICAIHAFPIPPPPFYYLWSGYLSLLPFSPSTPPNICEPGLWAKQMITVLRNILFSPSMSNSNPDCFNEHIMMQGENKIIKMLNN